MKLHRALTEAIDAEFSEATHKLAAGHALTVHVRTHWAMLRYAQQYGGTRDVVGQVGRLLSATLFTWLWVPEGNTGGTNIGAFEKLPIPPKIQELIAPAGHG